MGWRGAGVSVEVREMGAMRERAELIVDDGKPLSLKKEDISFVLE